MTSAKNTTELADPRWVSQVLVFWFEDVGASGWFARNQQVDTMISARFGVLYEAIASRDDFDFLLQRADDALASVIVLDQFSRNMFRDHPNAFAADPKARAIASAAIDKGLDQRIVKERRLFFYLPFEHSEDPADQVRSLELISALGDEKLTGYAEAHKDVIDRFGRFPHRNSVLGRTSTAEEIAFLQTPGSSF